MSNGTATHSPRPHLQEQHQPQSALSMSPIPVQDNSFSDNGSDYTPSAASAPLPASFASRGTDAHKDTDTDTDTDANTYPHTELLSLRKLRLQGENEALKMRLENVQLKARLAAQQQAQQRPGAVDIDIEMSGGSGDLKDPNPGPAAAAGREGGEHLQKHRQEDKRRCHQNWHDPDDDAPLDGRQDPPDVEYCCDTTILLSRGTCAYRLDVPEPDGQADFIPLVVCLHDLMNCSSMWRDLSHLITHATTGPPARVLAFDFYGRGRSLYTTGIKCSLELFVEQLRDLLDATGLLQEVLCGHPVMLIGQGMGACVAAGFAAKYSGYVHNLTLLSPLGAVFGGHGYKQGLLRLPVLGEALWRTRLGRCIERTHRKHCFHDPHSQNYSHVVKRELRMLTWQKHNAQGYFCAIRSTLQHFPLHDHGLVSLYNSLGRNPLRRVLVVWGEEDAMCDCNEGMEEMSRCFTEAGQFLRVPRAGRYTLVEGFPMVAKEVLGFLKANTAALRKSLRGY